MLYRYVPLNSRMKGDNRVRWVPNRMILCPKTLFHFITGSVKFYLSQLVDATENFSDGNKIGQGSFGCVYKVLSSIEKNVSS